MVVSAVDTADRSQILGYKKIAALFSRMQPPPTKFLCARFNVRIMERMTKGASMSASDKHWRNQDRLRCCSCLFYFILPVALVSVWLVLIPSSFWSYWWLPLVSGFMAAVGFADCIQAFEWMNDEAVFKIVVSAFASPGCLIAVSFFPLIPSDLLPLLLLLLSVAVFSSGWLIYIWIEGLMVMP